MNKKNLLIFNNNFNKIMNNNKMLKKVKNYKSKINLKKKNKI